MKTRTCANCHSVVGVQCDGWCDGWQESCLAVDRALGIEQPDWGQW